MTAYNVVRFRVKPGMEDKFVASQRASLEGDMPGAVAFAGRAFGSASERLAIVLRSLLPVMITAFFAGLVLFLALSMFEPMVALIDALAGKAVM